jgi:hypothetical protein
MRKRAWVLPVVAARSSLHDRMPPGSLAAWSAQLQAEPREARSEQQPPVATT